jgi:hypothetical protein
MPKGGNKKSIKASSKSKTWDIEEVMVTLDEGEEHARIKRLAFKISAAMEKDSSWKSGDGDKSEPLFSRNFEQDHNI